MAERLAPGDGFVVALAIATATGAWIARDVPLAFGALCTAVGAVRRSRFLVLAGLFLLGSGLAAQAWQSIRPLPERAINGRALLVSDPEPIAGGVRVRLELDGRRFDAWARSGSASLLRSRAAGELVEVQGRTESLPERSEHLQRRHVAERLQVERVGRWWPGSVAARAANGLRRLLDSGARSLAPSERALYAGFVLGDDRGQDPEIADAFEASGLTHLLAVSGANVGFVVLLAQPLLARLGLRTRAIVTIGILVFFAMLTRFEPSVVRATSMAVVSVVAVSRGLPISGVRILALAVIGVLLIDPMLVGVVGFQLSVLASLAIIVATPALARWLRGPAWLRDSLAVTIAAQVGVAPVLITVFGGIPLASMPANVLAGPAAGPLMVYGLVGGSFAGIAAAVGAESVAAVLHLPTRALLWWVTTVARAGVDAGFGELGGSALAMLGGAVGLVAWRRRIRQRAASNVAEATVPEPDLAAQTAGLRLLLGESVEGTGRSGRSMVGSALVGAVSVVLVIVALGPAVLAPWRPAELPAGATIALATGAVLWTSGSAQPAVLVVDGRVQGRELLEVARRKRIRRIPIVVAATASAALADALGPIARRLQPETVLAPPDARGKIAGARVPSDRDLLRVNGFTCWLRVTSDRIDLERDGG